MGTITKRQDKNGKYRFLAQIRIKRKDLPNFTKSKTFSKESLAKEWIKKVEAEIELNPDLLKHPAYPCLKGKASQIGENTCFLP